MGKLALTWRRDAAAVAMAVYSMLSRSRCGVHPLFKMFLTAAFYLLALSTLAEADVTNAVASSEAQGMMGAAAAPANVAGIAADSANLTGGSLLKPILQSAEELGTAVPDEHHSRTQMSLSEAQAEADKWVCGQNSELYFLIANPLSGSRLGAKYITSLPMVQVSEGCAELKVFSQRDAGSLALGLEHIVRAVDALKVLHAQESSEEATAKLKGDRPAIPLSKRVRVIAVGGDGAFTGAVMAVSKAGADMNWVAAGIIPSGTGNDLAHTHGWTRAHFPAVNPLGRENLGKLLDVLRSSDLVYHDYWTVVVKTDPDTGKFEAWSSDEGKMVTLGADRHGGPKTKSFVMGNYFGLGFDGLVGISFDRLRGKSRLWNRAMYGYLFLKNWGAKPTVCDTVDTLFTLNPKIMAVLSNNKKYRRVPGMLPCVSLTFLNAKTMLGGMELWRSSAKLGVRPPSDPGALSRYESFARELMATRLNSGDGKIEIFSMATTADYVQAQMIRANAIQRLMQGPGPFLLTFKETVPYMPIQVDGEFFIVCNLSSISVRRMGTYGMMRFRDSNEKP